MDRLADGMPGVGAAAHPSYCLQELHLYNWGAFQGWHMASIDPHNTAIIGPTGSGKTTVIDALMTLLCANPKYNLASTGGHESDRDLVSYVRGVSGPGTEGSSDHISRNGKTVTGLAARMVGEAGQQVWLGAVLWFDGSSSAVADLQRRWLFAENTDQSLNGWLEEHHRGGARALTQLGKNTEGLSVHTSKSAYLAKLQSHFEVGANAFTLLNRAAGLKQLNSIDEIFRELVLDDHAAFDHALQVADGFEELTSIHNDLELANRQFATLLPLRELDHRHRQQSTQLAALEGVATALPQWFAQQGVALWQARVEQVRGRLTELDHEVDAANAAIQVAEQEEQTRLQVYLQAGGSGIEDLQRHIEDVGREVGRRQQNERDYRALLHNLALTPPERLSAASVLAQQAQATQMCEDIARQMADHQAELEAAIADAHNAQQDHQRVMDELALTRKRPGSNIPPALQKFRADLAEQLGQAVEGLPFVAELVEVQKHQQHWRGAIERALGSQRLRVLVAPEHMRDALWWVNQRHNQVHVRLLEARPPVATPRFWDDGFCAKLNIKTHAHEGALRQLLADLDRHCVDSPEALQHTPHAMTQQGLMSGKAQHFDKQDQKRLQDDWMTGFDNRDRLAMLERDLQEAGERLSRCQDQKDTALKRQRDWTAARHLWQLLGQVQFEAIDVASVQAEHAALQQRLQALLNPQSDTARAQAAWELARTHTHECRQTHVAWMGQHAVAVADEKRAQAQQQRYAQRLTQTDALPPSMEAHFAVHLPLACDTLDDSERPASQALQQRLLADKERLAGLTTTITKQMTRARQDDRGALAEVADELDAMPVFLARLRVLEEEDLPAKRQAFQAYLNESSEQGVNGLFSGIHAQVIDIRERIDALNRTLMKVDFQPGRHLQLQSQDVVYPVLKTLNGLLSELRSARLREDGGESHYRVLRDIVQLLREHATNRRTKPAQALFDPRYRLQFAVAVHDRASGQVLERRTGSQGGSGGEKEIIASYVLTASLSYALCPAGRTRPVFASVVLDEAFSKSSQAVAGRIIEALREFGLHALFVTPNKELRLLRNHTRSAVVVHRKGSHATLTSLAWEELDRARQTFVPTRLPHEIA
ncbi:ATP-binding protein [Hydrogenophaga atypica]|uniref:ATP-binding protein n=1 Tax=Hydrogenophaga atypica TaxID=249409 RepID=A0ABW2QD35_9BURK